MGGAVALKWHDATIRELADQGHSGSDIARSLGASVAGVCRYCKVNGIPLQHGNRGKGGQLVPSERDVCMVDLHKQGFTLQVIGDKYGLTRERVRQILKDRHGITYKDSPRPAEIAQRQEARRKARREATEARILQHWGVEYAEWKALRKDGTVRRYEQHRNNARSRAIPFLLTFPQWLAIWRDSGKMHLAGKGKGKYCMARRGDAGAYEVGNVDIKPTVENSREAVEQWRGKTKANRGVHLLYPGRPKPWMAKVKGKSIGYFPDEQSAVTARNNYMASLESATP